MQGSGFLTHSVKSMLRN